MSKNVVWQEGRVTKEHRKELLGHNNKVIWFTGLSASGKTTIAQALERELHKQGKLVYVLDGDNVRHGLNKDLGFSDEDDKKNIRRIREVAKILYDAGVIVLVSFISPFRADRDIARELIGEDFIEVYVKCSLDECENRDPKGLYKKARAGIIPEFTGIDSPYEEPLKPELVLETDKHDLHECIEFLRKQIKV